MTHYAAAKCADAIIADANAKADAAGLTPSERHFFVVSRLRSELVTALGCIDDKYQEASFLRIINDPPAVVSIQPVAISGPGS